MASVTITQGTLRGAKVESDGGFPYYEFLGIPYAKPPVGELRFKEPQPPESWDGERDATTIDKTNYSLQLDLKEGKIEGSEDCLYLNVYTPKLNNSDSNMLPVMFFIHGGGFIYSNGIDKVDLGPEYLIETNVVVVTINYRLGVFGFLQLGIPEAAGNMGLKDQVLALRWVQNNIDTFGGDRNNVTIFGISAGAASVEYQILSPLAKGLFHKAILQSGSSLNHWTINYDPKKTVLELIKKMGYQGNTEDIQAIYKYLYESSATLITESSSVINDITQNRLYFGFVPTIENDFGNNSAFLTEYPYKLLKEGRFNQVPVIKGFCNKEGYLMNQVLPNMVLKLNDKKNFFDSWSYQISSSDKQKFESSLLTAYTECLQDNDESDKVGIDFYSDLDFNAGIWLSGELMERKKLPVYFYEFCYDGKMNFFKYFLGLKRPGAAHGDDLAYIFKHTVTQFATKKDIAVRTNMTKLWTNFAKTSNPTSDGVSIEWPQFKKESPAYLSINENLEIKSNYEPKKMAAFREIYEKYEK